MLSDAVNNGDGTYTFQVDLASNPELVDILGENARKHVLENYTWNKKFDLIFSYLMDEAKK